MNKTMAIILPLAMAAIFTACNTVPKSGGPATINLFNGKDLAKWNYKLADDTVTKDQVWSVQNGVIVCKGEPMGYLYSKQNFVNFKYEAEYRWAPGKTPGNSGLFARITGEPRPLPRCIEVQLKHGDAGDLYGFHGLKISGDAARFRHVPNHELAGELHGLKRLSGNENPAGQWNQVVVEAKDGNVAVWFNGVKVNEATNAEVVAGPVGLQSEGGEIHFRNVRITPLN